MLMQSTVNPRLFNIKKLFKLIKSTKMYKRKVMIIFHLIRVAVVITSQKEIHLIHGTNNNSNIHLLEDITIHLMS